MAAHDPEAKNVERRRSPRIEAGDNVSARLLTGTAQVRLHDLGSGGFSIVSDQPFVVGEVHRFTFQAGKSPATIVSGRVAYSRRFFVLRDDDQHFTGFAFTSLDDRSRRAVERLMDQLTSALSFD